MKLYFSPGACSLSPHIVMREAGIPVELVQVNLATHKTKDGGDYLAVNPKGYVPAIELPGGDKQVLTEGPAIVQYLADQHPEAKLAPPAGTLERARLQEWLNFITAEIHKGFGPLFNPHAPAEAKEQAKERLTKRLAYLDKTIGDRDYLLGAFSVADAYLFTVLRWTFPNKIDLSGWPKLEAYFKRVGARPAVVEALSAEGK